MQLFCDSRLSTAPARRNTCILRPHACKQQTKAAADGRGWRQLSFDSMAVQQGGMESDLLWAGYSEHSEQLRRLQLQNERLLSTIDDLHSKVAALQQQQQQPPSASLWQAASFLLFFLGFINCCSLVAQFNLGLFVPWGMARGSTAVLAKQLLGVLLPLTNTAVVLVMCAQAIRAAVRCLRF